MSKYKKALAHQYSAREKTRGFGPFCEGKKKRNKERKKMKLIK